MVLAALVLARPPAQLDAQHAGAFMGSIDDPVIAYSTARPHNLVADLNAKLQQSTVQLAFDPRSGYLQPVLDALRIPVDSQLLVFSRGSLQGNDKLEELLEALGAEHTRQE